MPDADKLTFEDLIEGITADYTRNGKNIRRLDTSLAHLKPFFAHVRARAIASKVDAYVALRLSEGAANASVNRELAALKRAVRIAVRHKRLGAPLDIEMLKENNVRKGFFERDKFDAIRVHLPEPEETVCDVSYICGWRIPSELLTRRWHHVDFVHGWLRLEPGEAKNDEARMFPLTPDLRAILEGQRAHTLQVERDLGVIIPWVFHRNGKPIRSMYGSWRAACKAAGYPGALMHDFRRTAVRNLERAGVPRSAAMKMTGHLTESVYRRYAITDEVMLNEAGAKLQTFHERHPGVAFIHRAGHPTAEGGAGMTVHRLPHASGGAPDGRHPHQDRSPDAARREVPCLGSLASPPSGSSTVSGIYGIGPEHVPRSLATTDASAHALCDGPSSTMTPGVAPLPTLPASPGIFTRWSPSLLLRCRWSWPMR